GRKRTGKPRRHLGGSKPSYIRLTYSRLNVDRTVLIQWCLLKQENLGGPLWPFFYGLVCYCYPSFSCPPAAAKICQGRGPLAVTVPMCPIQARQPHPPQNHRRITLPIQIQRPTTVTTAAKFLMRKNPAKRLSPPRPRAWTPM